MDHRGSISLTRKEEKPEKIDKNQVNLRDMTAQTVKPERQRPERKITVELDHVTSDDESRTRLHLYVGKDAFMAASDKTSSNESNVFSIDNHSMVLSEKASETVAYLTNTGDNTVTTLLVRPDENNELKISAVVLADKFAGKLSRIPIEDVVLSNEPAVGKLEVGPSHYTLMQHVADFCSGYLRPDFYEKVNDHGYGLTMRSLVRHLVNNVEIYMGKNSVEFDGSNRILENELLVSSFANNLSIADTKRSCGNLVGHAGWRAGMGTPFVAQCENELRTNGTSNGLAYQQVRRQLGIDASLSPAESSTLVGVAAVGIALSLLLNRRKPLMQRIGFSRVSASLRVGSPHPNKRINSTLAKSFKNQL